ncbi:hypothetical protein RAC90_05315 [Pantoea sp. CS_6]|uniref:hypothetical protein n=1 Tax=Pantoea sp. CS_6 TaxID=3055795 RepID=UPI0035C0DE2F
MKLVVGLFFLLMVPFASASQNKYYCEIFKGSEDSSGKQTLGPSLGQAAIIDDGNKFFIYVNEKIQLQSPKLKKEKDTQIGVSNDGFYYVKGKGYYLVAHDKDGFLFDNCKIQK